MRHELSVPCASYQRQPREGTLLDNDIDLKIDLVTARLSVRREFGTDIDVRGSRHVDFFDIDPAGAGKSQRSGNLRNARQVASGGGQVKPCRLAARLVADFCRQPQNDGVTLDQETISIRREPYLCIAGIGVQRQVGESASRNAAFDFEFNRTGRQFSLYGKTGAENKV